MSKALNIAIVGVTGAVGETMLTVLQERAFVINNFYPLASERSTDKTVMFNKRCYDVEDLAQFDFSKADIALFSAGSEVSRCYAPKAVEAGCVVIDNTACFRRDRDIPLIIPEVNAHCINQYFKKGIIANPNCSTIQMLMVLHPLHKVAGLKRINVATYQAVSGTGRKAISELVSQVGELLNGRPIKPCVYPKQIAFNALPHIDEFLDNGYTKEEMKMVWETQKILQDETVLVNPTAVRVPILHGHSEVIHVEFNQPISAVQARLLLKKAKGVKVVDDIKKHGYPTVITHAIGKDDVFVGRIREDITNACGLNLWIVADNLRKGAATNAIQIAEILQAEYL